MLDINPSHLGVTNSSQSGTSKDPHLAGDPSTTDEGLPWLDLESGNHQWTPHPFKIHGPKNTVPCEENPNPIP